MGHHILPPLLCPPSAKSKSWSPCVLWWGYPQSSLMLSLLLTGPRLPPADWTSPFGDTSLTLGESEGTPMQPILPESFQA